MTGSSVEMADVFRRFGTQFVLRCGQSLSLQQRKVIEAIERCRTAALGGHKQECDRCDHHQFAYNSCRNRHCPKCQAGARAKWTDARASELLPVPYFHVVFTLPQCMAKLALQNKAVVYDILFRATAETLKEVAANPRHLGARIGFFAVLHTWGQLMDHHPHLHCVIPAGGLSPNGQWKHCRRSRKSGKLFFLPVAVLSEVFRGKFIDHLRQAYRQDKLSFFGAMSTLQFPDEFERFLDTSVRSNWVVFAKRPFTAPENVIKYLARYTHRVAISNSRLVEIDEDSVQFSWKNYRKNHEIKTTRMKAHEFMRRFLLHVLPKGFTRIRHYGILANRLRRQTIETCRVLLAGAVDQPEHSKETETEISVPTQDDSRRCPNCQQGEMRITDSWNRGERGTMETSISRGLLLAWGST